MITLAFSFMTILLPLIIGFCLINSFQIFSILKMYLDSNLKYIIVQRVGNLNNNEAFHPLEVSLSKNSNVIWSNDDCMEHTITTDVAEAHLFD